MIRPEALDRAGEAVAQRDGGLEPHPLARPRDVEVPRRLAVRLRGVPVDLARVADEVADRLGQLSDARLDAGADVDRLRAVEVLGREQQRAGGVVDVEELARGGSRAPEVDGLV